MVEVHRMFEVWPHSGYHGLYEVSIYTKLIVSSAVFAPHRKPPGAGDDYESTDGEGV
jgi:hypothetical protein